MSNFGQKCSYNLINPEKSIRTIFDGKSKLEGYFAKHIDRSTSVLKWFYEAEHSKSLRYTFKDEQFSYIPDFLLELDNGEKFMVEVKASVDLTDERNIAKWIAAKKFFADQDIIFGVFTELAAPWMSWSIPSNNDDLIFGVEEEINEIVEIPTPPSVVEVVKDVEPPPKKSWWEKTIPMPKK